MKTKKIAQIIVLITLLFSFQSCKKTVGYGGNCGIKGVLKSRNYNSNFTTLKSETVLKDEYVYIVFEDGKGYGDRVKTSYDGSFSFTHLKTGKYKVYAYSKDSTMMSLEDVILIKDVEITKNKQLVDVGEIKITTNVSQPGNSNIKAKVFAHTANLDFYATNQKVYITYEGESTYSNSVYTDDEGEFQFTSVPIGHHKVYVFSKNTDPNATSPTIPVSVFVDVVNNNETHVLSDININK